ncbi:hypothetical protein R1flu_026381 [Riccia fluitans]|uniref:Uncharacterized protein n=1 Tax=Riccia fluitans TaxID=41844 RepID=A0ABD1XFS8_9MARC
MGAVGYEQESICAGGYGERKHENVSKLEITRSIPVSRTRSLRNCDSKWLQRKLQSGSLSKSASLMWNLRSFYLTLYEEMQGCREGGLMS